MEVIASLQAIGAHEKIVKHQLIRDIGGHYLLYHVNNYGEYIPERIPVRAGDVSALKRIMNFGRVADLNQWFYLYG